MSTIDESLENILRNHVYVLTQEILNPTPQKGNEVYTKPTIRELKALITEEVRQGRIDELKHIDDPVNVNLYFEGLISVKDRIKTLSQNKTGGLK